WPVIAARRRAFEPADQACDDDNVCTANPPATAPASARWWGSSIWCRATTGMPARPLTPAWPPCGGPGAVAVRPRRLTSDVPLTSQDYRDDPLHDLTTSGINLESHLARTQHTPSTTGSTAPPCRGGASSAAAGAASAGPGWCADSVARADRGRVPAAPSRRAPGGRGRGTGR